MPWTAPRTWVTSEIVTAAMMNTHIRDNLLAIHDLGVGNIMVLDSCDTTVGTGALGDIEIMRGWIPLTDFYSQGFTMWLRVMGMRQCVNNGAAGNNTLTLSAGSVSPPGTGIPTLFGVTTIAQAVEATWAARDTGWVVVPGTVTTTRTILYVHVGLDAANTGQTSYFKGSVLAKVL